METYVQQRTFIKLHFSALHDDMYIYFKGGVYSFYQLLCKYINKTGI